MKNEKLSKLFNNNIFWAVISLVAALGIWVYMTGTQTEPIEKTLYGVQVAILGEEELQATRGLVVTDVSVQTVDVTISGTRMNIGRLSSDDVQAVIDVQRLTNAGMFTLNYSLSYPDGVDSSAVRIVRSSPSSVKSAS